MQIYNEQIDYTIDIPDVPHRIVCLSSGFTESLFAMGLADSVVGVSAYCSRYVDTGDRPVVGDYLTVDRSRLDGVHPDLVIATGGIQRRLVLTLKDEGYPVYPLPLPETFWGICDSAVRLGALAGDVAAGRRLATRMTGEAESIRSAWRGRSPRVYIEAWFGRHPRTIGGRSFIHDTVRIAGGSPLLSDHPAAYLPLDAAEERRSTLTHADFLLGFHEPEFHVDFAEVAARRWPDESDRPRVIVSDTARGRNIIHDGPSLLETARWLQQEFAELGHS